MIGNSPIPSEQRYGRGLEYLLAGDTRIAEIEANQPDLETERQSHRAAVEKLEAKHSQFETDFRSKLAQANRRSVLQQLTLELKGLNPVYAEVAAERAMKRVLFKDDGSGEHEVMQESQIPFVAANGRTPIQLLAAEIVSTAPKELVVSHVDRGTGGKPDISPAGGDKPVWQQMREKGAAANTADKARQDKVSQMFSPPTG